METLITLSASARVLKKMKMEVMKMRTNKCKPCGESSPYWNWVDDNATGDPDYVGVEDSKGADPLLQSVLDT